MEGHAAPWTLLCSLVDFLGEEDKRNHFKILQIFLKPTQHCGQNLHLLRHHGYCSEREKNERGLLA